MFDASFGKRTGQDVLFDGAFSKPRYGAWVAKEYVCFEEIAKGYCANKREERSLKVEPIKNSKFLNNVIYTPTDFTVFYHDDIGENIIKEDTNSMADLLYRIYQRLLSAIDDRDSTRVKDLSNKFNSIEDRLEKLGFDVEKFMLSKGVDKVYEQSNLNEDDKFWMGDIGDKDDFGAPIKDEFIDCKTNMGPWGIMSPESFKTYGVGLGTGRGQKYKKQPDGKWKKIQG